LQSIGELKFDFQIKNKKPYKISAGGMFYDEILKREIPIGWSVRKFADIVTSINTGLNPRDNFVLGNGDKDYVTIKNIGYGELDLSNADKIDAIALKIIRKRSKLEKGDILFTSIEPIGRCYYINEEPTNWDINESVFSIKNNRKVIINDALLYSIVSSQEFIMRGMRKTAGSVHKGIRIEALKDIDVLIPPIKVQEKISRVFEQSLSQIANQNIQYSAYSAMRDFLLPLLMNGQVTVGTTPTPEQVVAAVITILLSFDQWKAQSGFAARSADGSIDEQSLQNAYQRIAKKRGSMTEQRKAEIRKIASDLYTKHYKRGIPAKVMPSIIEKEDLWFAEVPLNVDGFIVCTPNFQTQFISIAKKKLSAAKTFQPPTNLVIMLWGIFCTNNQSFCNKINETDDNISEQEREASYFASSFLLPRERIENEFTKLFRWHISQTSKVYLNTTGKDRNWTMLSNILKKQFCVTQIALKIALVELNLINNFQTL
jgi:hypothetical protein